MQHNEKIQNLIRRLDIEKILWEDPKTQTLFDQIEITGYYIDIIWVIDMFNKIDKDGYYEIGWKETSDGEIKTYASADLNAIINTLKGLMKKLGGK